MKTPLKPLADRIIASQDPPKDQTASGIFLTENAKLKSFTAKVVAVGKSVKEVKAGDTIIYKEYGVTLVSIEKEEFLIIKEEDILAKI